MVYRISPVLRRVQIALLVLLVLSSMLIGWVSDRAHELFHYLILRYGLLRVEDWLKQRSIGFASALVIALVYGGFHIKSYVVILLFHHDCYNSISVASSLF